MKIYSNYEGMLVPPETIKDLDIEIYTDYFVMDCKKNDAYAVLVEPRSIMPEVYRYMERNGGKFKKVFTFDSQLLKNLDNAKVIYFGEVAEFWDEPKTKGISMVCSNKDYCEGHRRRRKLAERLKGTIDTYGSFDGGGFVDNHTIYANYRFNVAVENYKDGCYFTEKICNCFASKTIPIYYGTERITDFFNSEGIILAELEDIPSIIENLDIEQEYAKRYEAVLDNFERVKEFNSFNRTFYRMYGDYLKGGCQMTSYSQEKEDLIIYSMLENVECGRYVDVGANDPDFISVTKLFYNLGWSGINIEPLEDKYKLLKEKRPRDINVNVGVGDKKGRLPFRMLDTGSTFSEEIVETCGYQNYPIKEVEVELLTDVVDRFYYGKEIHFCKIDVEGYEKEVLLGIQDWEKFRPWVYCIESTIPSTDIPCYEEWEYLLIEHDYELVLAHGINRFYVDKRVKDKLNLNGLNQFK